MGFLGPPLVHSKKVKTIHTNIKTYDILLSKNKTASSMVHMYTYTHIGALKGM